MDKLEEMMKMQEDLQANAYGDGISPRWFDNEGKIEFIKTNVIALTDELHEALAEVGWKPWASSRHINEEAFQAELVDAFHFFMNLCIVGNMTPEMLFEKYQAKRLKNIKRQEEGYDGVSTKCPGCKRALDDDAVECYFASENDAIRTYWCTVEVAYYRVGKAFGEVQKIV